MNSTESRVMGWVCLIFGLAFGLLNAPLLSLVFCIFAFGFLAWTIYKDHIEGGGGPGPLKPA
jgi:hypothetical protein